MRLRQQTARPAALLLIRTYRLKQMAALRPIFCRLAKLRIDERAWPSSGMALNEHADAHADFPGRRCRGQRHAQPCDVADVFMPGLRAPLRGHCSQPFCRAGRQPIALPAACSGGGCVQTGSMPKSAVNSRLNPTHRRRGTVKPQAFAPTPDTDAPALDWASRVILASKSRQSFRRACAISRAGP